jgi:SAM-dependent methyltransferase
MAEFAAEFVEDGSVGNAGGRLDAPAFHRNHAPIWAVLERFLKGRSGDVLEAGSGTGQHVVFFAGHTPDITWWPSDPNEAHLNSILAWRAQAGLKNIRAPLAIDLSASAWPPALPDKLLAVFCANVIHIAPWRAAEGLFAQSGRRLQQGGHLFLYGPFKRAGHHTAISNAVFDTSLRNANPEWGVRDIADLEKLAARNGLALQETIGMPANNMMLVLAKG